MEPRDLLVLSRLCQCLEDEGQEPLGGFAVNYRVLTDDSNIGLGLFMMVLRWNDHGLSNFRV